jgi:hypothetical protein
LPSKLEKRSDSFHATERILTTIIPNLWIPLEGV